jgi:IS66 C-terminal element
VLQIIRHLLIRSGCFRLERELPGGTCTHETSAPSQGTQLNGVEPLAWLTDVLERVVAGRTKAHELARLLPSAWKAEQLAVAVGA